MKKIRRSSAQRIGDGTQQFRNLAEHIVPQANLPAAQRDPRLTLIRSPGGGWFSWRLILDRQVIDARCSPAWDPSVPFGLRHITSMTWRPRRIEDGLLLSEGHTASLRETIGLLIDAYAKCAKARIEHNGLVLHGGQGPVAFLEVPHGTDNALLFALRVEGWRPFRPLRRLRPFELTNDSDSACARIESLLSRLDRGVHVGRADLQQELRELQQLSERIGDAAFEAQSGRQFWFPPDPEAEASGTYCGVLRAECSK